MYNNKIFLIIKTVIVWIQMPPLIWQPYIHIGSATIRRYYFVGVVMTLLKKEYHCGEDPWGFIYSGYHSGNQLISCYLHDIAVSVPGHLYLQAFMLHAMMIIAWTSETVSEPPKLIVFLNKSCYGHSVSSQKWKYKWRNKLIRYCQKYWK